MKVAFLGTPNIGAHALQSLIDAKIEVVVVVTLPNKKIGRSHSEKQPTPVATLADKYQIPIIKTNSINKDIDELKKYDFEYMITCAFGQFLSDDVLSLPTKKALNVHGSLLPEGRGGAPIHWAIIKGKKVTGITIMEMASKMDAGDYYSQYKIDIDKNDTTDILFEKMSNLILEKTGESIKEIDAGMKAIPQDEEKVTFWMNVKKEDAKIDFNQNVNDVYNQIRGLTSKPGAWTTLNGKIVKVHSSEIIDETKTGNKPGTIIDLNKNGALVQTKQGIINIIEITLDGKKRNSVGNLINSSYFKINDIFS